MKNTAISLCSAQLRLRTTTALAAGLGVLCGLSSPALANTTGAMVISSDTILVEDHEGSIEISGNGIVLDCNGHTIRPSASMESAGVHANGVSGATIKNCDIADFSTGIALVSAPGFTVKNNHLDNAADFGLRADESDNLTVVQNEAQGSPGAMAIAAFLSDGIRVEDNRVNGYGDGVFCIGCDDVSISLNSVAAAEESGIWLNSSSNAAIHGNSVTTSGFAGITLTESNGVSVTGNLLDGNITHGLNTNRISDISMSGNIATNNGGNGFDLLRVSGYQFTGNLASGNAGVGMLFRFNDDGTIQFNNSTNNAVYDGQQIDGANNNFFANIFVTSDGI